MKKLIVLLVVLMLVALPAAAQAGAQDKPVKCTTIQDKVLTYATGHYLAGQLLRTGFDAFGYNYQAHEFKGSFANSYLGKDGFPPYQGDDAAYLAANPTAAGQWYWPYRNDQLAMKWDEGWLSNKDCDGDGKLDRHFGFPKYIGSSAWLTNHQSGEYDLSGQSCKWNYFVKIVAVPSSAYDQGGVWYTVDGTEIGAKIWGEFATIQEVSNDPCADVHGVQYVSPDGPGLGKW